LLANVLSIILALIGICAVLALTYFASRWYAGRVGPVAAGRYIKVVDRVVVGKAASILLIELEGVQYLIGAAEQGICILKELDEPVRIIENQQTFKGINFRDILGRYGGRKGNDL
jgi:flagellar protein FliO/FliZ